MFIARDTTIDTADYCLTINPENSYAISDLLYGLFLEDINFAIDGGLYAEMIKNRSFEYGDMARNGNMHGWNLIGEPTYQIVDGSVDFSYLNKNNPTYLTLTASLDVPVGIRNYGFLDGMTISKNNTYQLSGYFRSRLDNGSTVTLQLLDEDGTIYAENIITGITKDWKKYTIELSPFISSFPRWMRS